MYNGNILKKRSAQTLLSATATVSVAVVNVIYFFENHPFASYGAGWFSYVLERFSERNSN